MSGLSWLKYFARADRARNCVASAGSSSKPFETQSSSFLLVLTPARFFACGFLSGFVRVAATTMDRLLAGACGGGIGQVAELRDF